MKNPFIIALIALCTAATAAAQCNNFDCAYKEAQRLLNSSEKDKYTKAMAYLEDAENFAGADKVQYEKVRALRKKAFVAIEKERKDAVEARKAAEEATKRANSLLKQVEAEKQTALAEKAKAEAAEKKATAVLDKIYFYDGKFGLAYHKDENNAFGRYGFIDKNLNIKIKFKYIEALPFDNKGFAKVKEYGVYYLIDTTGKQYKLATNISQLDSSITALDLQNSALVDVLVKVGEYPQLAILLLDHNKLTTLPSEIGKLTNLRCFDLFNTKLTALPPEIGKLANLMELNLSNNKLTTLPSEIGNLTNLTTLYLFSNKLMTLPSEISNLTNLKTLVLFSNELTALPPEIGKLTNLTTLSLANNDLTALPPEIGKLQSLQCLYLQNNPIPPTEQEKIRKLLPNCTITF